MISGEPDSRPPLPKILQVAGVLAAFASLGYLTLRGLSLEELMIPAAALGLPVYLIVLVDPIIGVAILIASIGLSPEFTIGGIRDLRMEDFLLPGLLLGWLLRAGHERTPFAPTRIWTPAVVSFVAMMISTLAGGTGRVGSPAMPYLIMGKYVEYMVMYLIVINTVKTEAEVRALAIFAILVAVTSTSISLSGAVAAPGNTVEGRVRGPHGETSNIYGAYIGLNMLLALGLFLHSSTPGARLTAGSAVVVLCVSLLFTYSRTSYVALGGAILYFGLFRHRRLLVILLILAAFVPVFAPASVIERIGTVGGVASGPNPPSWSARLYAWDWALGRMSLTDWVYGKGIGSVAFGDVDSEYVRIFSDMGVVGIVLFGWMLFRIGRLANQTYNAQEDFTFPRGYMAGYLMGFVAMVIHSVAATTFSAIRTEEIFMVFTGLMTVLANRQEALHPTAPDRPVVLLENASILEPQARL